MIIHYQKRRLNNMEKYQLKTKCPKCGNIDIIKFKTIYDVRLTDDTFCSKCKSVYLYNIDKNTNIFSFDELKKSNPGKEKVDFSIDSQFKNYINLIGITENSVSSTQFTETKNAFYGGVASLITLLLNELTDDYSLDEGVVILDKLLNEALEHFDKSKNDYKKKKSIQNIFNSLKLDFEDN